MNSNIKIKTDDSEMNFDNYNPKREGYKYKSIIFEITIAIISIITTVFICIMIFKTNISVEGLISVLLAFFSIFISILFYIKASETSNIFYIRSYDIMKDVSVSLGKIEERFGERLNNMNNTLSSLAFAKVETKQDLQKIEDEKDKLINELMLKLDQKILETEKFKDRFDELNRDADILKNKLIDLEYNDNNNIIMQHNDLNKQNYEKTVNAWIKFLGERDKKRLMNGGKVSPENKNALNIGIEMGLINEMGSLTDKGRYVLNQIYT
jgi:hypothetical protein